MQVQRAGRPVTIKKYKSFFVSALRPCAALSQRAVDLLRRVGNDFKPDLLSVLLIRLTHPPPLHFAQLIF